MSTRVRSHAKINLGLHIGAPRADGFHGLATVYQTLEVHDFVTVEARPAAQTRIRLTSNDARVPTDERNTAWKMVSLVLEEMGVRADVSLHIEKRLPVQGGLGAGSANAVAALVGLEKELGFGGGADVDSQVSNYPSDEDLSLGTPESRSFTSFRTGSGAPNSVVSGEWSGVGLPEHRRLEIAAKVGSDVPLFLVGGTVLGVDRGQEVYPLPDTEPVWCVVALPEVGVSTPQAFRDWDALCAEQGLTQEAGTAKLSELSRAYAKAFSGTIPGGGQAGSSGVPAVGGDLAEPLGFALVQTGIKSWIENDFEQVVFRQHPSLVEIKHLLLADGLPERALHASLSGSGSALFGLYQGERDAVAAVERLTTSGVRSLLTRTCPRKAYRDAMLQ